MLGNVLNVFWSKDTRHEARAILLDYACFFSVCFFEYMIVWLLIVCITFESKLVYFISSHSLLFLVILNEMYVECLSISIFIRTDVFLCFPRYSLGLDLACCSAFWPNKVRLLQAHNYN